MNLRRCALSLFLSLVWALPVWSQSVSPSKPAPAAGESLSDPTAPALRISAGDLIDINVFDTAELSAKLRVDERGDITVPLAGTLHVAGLTAEEAAHAIEVRFRETNILKDPHVSVTVLEYATQGVTVLGEVRNPGVYPLLGAHGLLDLISAAGGVTPNAGPTVTVTHRADPEHPVVVDLDNKSGHNTAFHAGISPGDTIMVSQAGIVYVVGAVTRPGGFLIQRKDRLTVLQAIALAQGTNRTAALNQAKLIRTTTTGRQELPVPLKKILANHAPDELLADGDILFVPSSAAKSMLRSVEDILPAATTASIYRVP